MSTKNAIALLASLSDDKKVFLDIAKAYVAEKLNVYYSVEGYMCIKEDDVIPFSELPEFEGLRNKISKIEQADTVIDDFFEISEDIDLINKYLDEEMLIAYFEVDDYDTDSVVEEDFTPGVSPLHEPGDMAEEALPVAEEEKLETVAEEEVVVEVAAVEQEPVESDEATAVVEEEPVAQEENLIIEEKEDKFDINNLPDDVSSDVPIFNDNDERIVGIYKEEYDTSWAPDYEPTEDDYFLKPFEDELGEEKPDYPQLFADNETKTEKDDILAEANQVIADGGKFIFTGCNPMVYLNKRLEYLRIKYALKNIEDMGDEDPEEEVETIKNELIKLRGYVQHGVILPTQAVQYDMLMVEKVYGLLKEFDERLYPADAMPNIDQLLEVMDDNSDFDEKAKLVNKFFRVDTVNFLKIIYKNCSSLKLDKNQRIKVERDRLDDIHFEDLRQLEREFYNQKNTLKGKLMGGKNDYARKKQELEEKYAADIAEMENNIKDLIEADTKMVGKNMKLYARIDKILRNNVMCFQAK